MSKTVKFAGSIHIRWGRVFLLQGKGFDFLGQVFTPVYWKKPTVDIFVLVKPRNYT